MLCEKLYNALKRNQYIFSISNTTKLLIPFSNHIFKLVVEINTSQ